MKNKLIFKLANRNIIKMEDDKYITLKYFYKIGKKLDFNNINTFNEKLQWLKLYDRNPKYTRMVDKYEAKEYVGEIIGKEHIIPTVGIYNNFNEIKWENIPNEFVIKCTHDSGGLVICKEKKEFNIRDARKKINKSLKQNYYYQGREWPYKNIKPRIIIEEYIKDTKSKDLKDYKIFCFNGKPQLILVCSNRNGAFKNTDFYDIDWNLMPFTRQNHTNNPKGIEKPKKLEEMLNIAEKLSKDIPFVRVDLYEVNGKIYFGELTFYPSSGFEGFNPVEYDKILGDMLELPKEKLKEKNEK